MNERAIELHELARVFHSEAYELLKTSERVLLRPDTRELADVALAVDRAVKFVEDTRKELEALRRKVDNLTCALWMRESATGEPIRTDYVTASPDIKMAVIAPHPKREPEQFAALMRDLGVPEALWQGEQQAVRPHWPGLCEYVSAQLAEGHPLPGGIDPEKTVPQYKLKLRQKKHIPTPGEQTIPEDEVPF